MPRFITKKWILRSLKMFLINWEIELILICSKNCVVLSNRRRDAIAATELIAGNVSNVKLLSLNKILRPLFDFGHV